MINCCFNWVSAVSAACAVFGAGFAWFKENKCSKNIKKDQYNRQVEKLQSNFENFLELSIKCWSNSGLKKGDLSNLENQITSEAKNVSLGITAIKKHFPCLVGDTGEFIQEFNKVNDLVTEYPFQSAKFKTDSAKVKLIISESASIKKIISSMFKFD